jgi:diaminohydroxyphosphoribosylaminopyrimidine deaminase / 5-amino-6-(5-phosphoribosylamino)uracil reductase
MKKHFNQSDEKYISFAINLARKNIGLTSSNPCVGSVLVKNNTIISTGITAAGGTPHSETIAIKKAGKNTQGATLYVTLEPCSHFGKMPPCTDLIIQSGISRVVIATIDPDLRVNGSGISQLKAAGIEVVVGVLEEKAIESNQGFFNNKSLERPFITLKLATSQDGKIATKDTKIKWISNEKSRQYAHYLRAKNDAILVGANTIRQDNPMLDCRLSGLEKYSPKRIILSSILDINLNSQIIQTAQSIPTYIATNNSNTKKFSDLGIRIINFENLNDLVKKLSQIGINNLLIEGGSVVATEFIKADLVDKLLWIKAPQAIGEHGINALQDLDISRIDQNFNFKITKTRMIQEDLLTEFNRKK